MNHYTLHHWEVPSKLVWILKTDEASAAVTSRLWIWILPQDLDHISPIVSDQTQNREEALFEKVEVGNWQRKAASSGKGNALLLLLLLQCYQRRLQSLNPQTHRFNMCSCVLCVAGQCSHHGLKSVAVTYNKLSIPALICPTYFTLTFNNQTTMSQPKPTCKLIANLLSAQYCLHKGTHPPTLNPTRSIRAY